MNGAIWESHQSKIKAGMSCKKLWVCILLGKFAHPTRLFARFSSFWVFDLFFPENRRKKGRFRDFWAVFCLRWRIFSGEKTAKSSRKTLFADEKTLLRCLRAILYLFISKFPGKKPWFFQKMGQSASFYIENSYKGISGQTGTLFKHYNRNVSVRRSRKVENLSASAADTRMQMLFSINAEGSCKRSPVLRPNLVVHRHVCIGR